MEDGRAFITKLRALKHGGQKAAAPVLWAAVDFGVIGHDDERGQILVGGAEAVESPGPERGPAGEDVAGVHLADGADVVQAVGIAGADHTEVVGMPGDFGIPVGNPQAALPVLAPLAARGHEAVAGGAHRSDGAAEGFRHRLAVQLIERGLWVE